MAQSWLQTRRAWAGISAKRLSGGIMGANAVKKVARTT